MVLASLISILALQPVVVGDVEVIEKKAGVPVKAEVEKVSRRPGNFSDILSDWPQSNAGPPLTPIPPAPQPAEKSAEKPDGPKDANSFFERGLARQGKGDLDGAIADYSEAIRLNPKDPDAHYNRGLARQKKGDRRGANADFEMAKKLGKS